MKFLTSLACAVSMTAATGLSALGAGSSIILSNPASGGPALVQQVQSTDGGYRVNELENEVRRLNGKVEELTFQLLEMQEQMRKLQADNELRFQDLEDKQSDASGVEPKTEDMAKAGDDRLGKPQPSGAENPDVNPAPQRVTQTRPKPSTSGEAPRSLGTLTFDASGNVINAGRPELPKPGIMAKLPGVFSDGVDGAIEAALFGPTPNAVFSVGKSALENKRFKRSEQAFRAYLKAWPRDPREGEARFFLGASLFGQNEYYKAANVYLDTHNAHPDSKTAADNLLGLGLALAGLNQREVACATYSEVLKQYPKERSRLLSKVEAEQIGAQC